MSICEHSFSSPTHSSFVVCTPLRLFSLRLILTKGHNTSIIPPDFLHFIHSPAPFLVRLSPCLLRLYAVSFMFSEPLLTHSFFSASPIVSLFWQLYHTFLSDSIFLLFSFRKKKIHSHKIDTQTGRCRFACTHLLFLAFYLLPFTLSLLQPRSLGEWINNIYDEALFRTALSVCPQLSVLSPLRIKWHWSYLHYLCSHLSASLSFNPSSRWESDGSLYVFMWHRWQAKVVWEPLQIGNRHLCIRLWTCHQAELLLFKQLRQSERKNQSFLGEQSCESPRAPGRHRMCSLTIIKCCSRCHKATN